MNHDHSQHDGELSKLFWRSCNSNGLIDLESLAASFLLRKHRAHFFGVLPILLLLAFPPSLIQSGKRNRKPARQLCAGGMVLAR